MVSDGDRLVLVGDASPGQVISIDVTGMPSGAGSGPLIHAMVIDTGRVTTIGGDLALDLESLEISQRGEILVLSERLHALVGRNGIVAEYPDSMSEIGGKGLEGVAVAEDGLVAALWEGGFYEQRKLPNVAGFAATAPLKPVVCVHRVDATDTEVNCEQNGPVALDVPTPPVSTQAFRAADLVWDGTDTLLVLLTSTNAANDAFKYKWLQKFNLDGTRSGLPLNLCAQGYLPDELRDGRDSNFEGLDWYEEGRVVVIVNDHKEPGTAVFIDVQSWPTAIDTTACDTP